MQGQDTPTKVGAPAKGYRDRHEVVRLVTAVEAGRAKGRSVKEIAEAEGVPVSSLYHVLARKGSVSAPELEKAFFFSNEGCAMLHRINTALHLAFGQAAGDGVDRLRQFLALSRLDRYLAASHGSQDAFAGRMEQLLAEYDQEQRAWLGAAMSPKTIVVCEDETFHPKGMCLVAIDAESGMILLEVYSERRDGETWRDLLDAAIGDLPVQVVQVVGDEAKGLIAHARSHLGCHYGPDLFHPQHDLSKATSLPLTRRLVPARQELAKAEERTQIWQAHKARNQKGPRSPGRPLDYDRRIAQAQGAEDAARADLDALVADKADVRSAIRSIGDAYHPVDMVTGEMRSAEQVGSLIDKAFATIDAIAGRAQLSERARQRIDKARRVMPKLIATMTFFQGHLERSLASLNLPSATLDVVRTQLAPGLYLQRAAKKARTAAERSSILAVSASLLDQARDPSSLFMALDLSVRQHIETVIVACLALFVRSSACVEGRNGHLARYHHGLHRLSEPRLKALTVIANYYALRPDRTTAAERFFGNKPDDLFLWLLDRIDLPALPRSSHLKRAA